VQRAGIKNEISREIRKGIKEEDLTRIVSTDKNDTSICWIKAGKEFKYLSEMYDVVKTKTFHHTKIFYCIRDSKENRLINGFSNSHKAKKEAERRLKRTFSNHFFSPLFHLSENNYATDFIFNTLNSHFETSKVITPSPPPRLA